MLTFFLTATRRGEPMHVQIHSNQPAPRTMAQRVSAMAEAMCRITAERGACTEDDLRAEGFTRSEIDTLGDQAKDEAAALQTQARNLPRRTVRA
jgi:hypothetical protein